MSLSSVSVVTNALRLSGSTVVATPTLTAPMSLRAAIPVTDGSYPTRSTAMKRYASLSMMALFLMAGAAFAGGQTTTPTTDHGQHKPAAADADFTKLDANKDGSLSKEELAKHKLAPHFGMLDSNKDGKLSPQEFAAGKGM